LLCETLAIGIPGTINKWLEYFAYRINIEWWVLALAGITSFLIALITISFQAIEAAVANPLKSFENGMSLYNGHYFFQVFITLE
jgi:hypothetical protein